MNQPSSSTRYPFEYAVLRVMPRIERAESINAGVVLYCRELNYLGARIQLDVTRVRALDPGADTAAIATALEAIAQACRPPSDSSTFEIGPRFRWLTAPRSTVVQPGPVHTGLTGSDVATELERLVDILVRPVE